MAGSKATTVTQVCDVSGLEGGVGFGKDSEATGAETAPPPPKPQHRAKQEGEAEGAWQVFVSNNWIDHGIKTPLFYLLSYKMYPSPQTQLTQFPLPKGRPKLFKARSGSLQTFLIAEELQAT